MSYEQLVSDNLKLVHACAHKFSSTGFDYDELYSAGCIGLVKAAKKFDTARGFQFSTYAVTVILGEIKQLFRENNPVKVSRSVKDLAVKAKKISDKLKLTLNREPTVKEIATALNVSSEEIAEAFSACTELKSLDNDETVQRQLVINNEEALITHISLNLAIEKLDDTEQKIIKLRYFSDKTQSDTAKALGLTQVQISRMEKSVLKKLREKLIC